jgi:hypothetical protein
MWSTKNDIPSRINDDVVVLKFLTTKGTKDTKLLLRKGCIVNLAIIKGNNTQSFFVLFVLFVVQELKMLLRKG